MRNDAVTVTETKKIRLSELYPVISQELDAGKEYFLPITGTSMYPTILGGRDAVILSRPNRPYKKYDLPLYQRASGQFVLHRIIAVGKDGTFTCCGDHQWKKETGLRPEQMLALAVKLNRKGKLISSEDPKYVRWVKFWVLIRPLRAGYYVVAGFLSKLKRRLLGKK